MVVQVEIMHAVYSFVYPTVYNGSSNHPRWFGVVFFHPPFGIFTAYGRLFEHSEPPID